MKSTMRKRMYRDFSIISIAVIIGLVIAIGGLIINSITFSKYAKDTEINAKASEIKHHVLETKSAYSRYMLTNEKKYVDEFDASYFQLQKSIEDVKKQTEDTYIIEIITEVELQVKKYEDTFKDMEIYVKTLSENFDQGGILGAEMIESLERMIKNSRRDDSNMNRVTTDGLANLLTARINLLRYYQTSDEVYFLEYANHYLPYMTMMELIENSATASNKYAVDYVKVMTNIKEYHNISYNIKEHKEKVDITTNKLNEQVTSMTKQVETVIAYVDEVQAKAQQEMTRRNQIRGFAILAILFMTAIVLYRTVRSFLRRSLEPIGYLQKSFEEIAEGEVNIDFRLPEDGNDEIGTMSKAFNRFVDKLAVLIHDMDKENKINAAETKLLDTTKDVHDPRQISQFILESVMQQTDAFVGKMYVFNIEKNELIQCAQVGMEKEEVPIRNPFAKQVITDKKMRILDNLSQIDIKVETELIDALPSHVMMLPCEFAKDVVAFIEVGKTGPFCKEDMEILDRLREKMGNVVHAVLLRHEAQVLLDKTLQQAEELQMQQEELQQTNSELELQKNELNTKHEEILMTQEELIAKANELELANKYKTEFFANMSHELRTPLNSILVLSQLLEKREGNEPLTKKEQEFASTIHRSGNELLNLINGILDLSKVESGKLEVMAEKFSIKELEHEMKNLFEPITDNKGIAFILQTKEDVPKYIITDKMRLGQILKNLLSNAIKFTKEGYVKLEIAKEGDAHIRFRVEDSGIGIEEGKKELIFEAFRQVDGTISRNYGGTGLGLSISLELTQLLEGEIQVESEKGKGSAFIVTLPIAYSEGISLMARNEVESKEKESQTIQAQTIQAEQDIEIKNVAHIHKEKTVLIIEKDKEFAEEISAIAEDIGFTTVISHTIKDAITVANDLNPEGMIVAEDIAGSSVQEIGKQVEAMGNIVPVHYVEHQKEQVKVTLPKSIIGILPKPLQVKSVYQILGKLEKLDINGVQKVLVVGDCDGENFEYFKNLAMIEVEQVETGKEGLEKVEKEAYGCLVLDGHLEDMKSTIFVEQLNALENIKIPVVIYTEDEMDLQIFDAKEAVGDSIILRTHKPSERLIDEITLFLHTLCDKRKKDKESQDKSEFHGKKILLMDDDERNIFSLLHTLEPYGFDVIPAKNGEVGIRKFKEIDDIDIVLTDIMMPKIDGYEVIEGIRKMEKGKDIPIIAITAKTMQEDRRKCIDAGANDYLKKPIDIEKLISLLRVWLG